MTKYKVKFLPDDKEVEVAEGHLDAKELYRRASARDKSISPATVYRSLNLFKELGLVDEIRLGKRRKLSDLHDCGRVKL
jgi:Fe2+ or Zn2+ uptake regulation protein